MYFLSEISQDKCKNHFYFNCITNYMQCCYIVYKRTQKQIKPQTMINPTFVTLCKIVLKRIQNVYTIVSSKVGRNIQPYGVLSKIIAF